MFELVVRAEDGEECSRFFKTEGEARAVVESIEARLPLGTTVWATIYEVGLEVEVLRTSSA